MRIGGARSRAPDRGDPRLCDTLWSEASPVLPGSGLVVYLIRVRRTAG